MHTMFMIAITCLLLKRNLLITENDRSRQVGCIHPVHLQMDLFFSTGENPWERPSISGRQPHTSPT